VSCTLIAALQNPALFPHPVTEFQVIETHISWVLLTGEFAYKIKKPVDFGFLDFTTLAQRKHFCEEELRLNQRLAADLYLELVPITGNDHAPQLGGAGQPLEYAVKMRQFAQSALLDAVQARGGLTAAHIDDLAAQIGGFHRTAAPVPDGHPLCSVEAIAAPMRENFVQIEPLLTDESDKKQLAALNDWMQSTIQRLSPLLAQRGAGGKIRECHGDLHLGNAILRENGQVALFDCIEFNEGFRRIDQALDAAFLAMDLQDRGLDGLAHRFTNAWLEQTGDWQALELFPLYKAHRALVRAKVGLFRLGQAGDEAQGKAIIAQYRAYIMLAERYSVIPSPFLLILHGLSGSGKSYLARQIGDASGAICLRSDVERKRLFEQPQARYSEQANQATYQHLHHLAEKALHAGCPVIVDAAYLRRSEREAARMIAENAAVPWLILACEAPLPVMEQRIAERKRAGVDPSDADFAVLRAQQGFIEPLDTGEIPCSLCVDTSASSAQLIDVLNGHPFFRQHKLRQSQGI